MKVKNILNNLNVLYVDDDKKACESLAHILKYYFHTVFIAHNGQEALEIYMQNQCHLLIVDYDMPVMDGYEFLSKVRENDDITSAIIMSSYDDKVKLKNAIKLNLLEYMVKPYELNDLKNILEIFVEQLQKKGLLQYQLTDSCHYSFVTKRVVEKDTEYKLTSFEIKIFEYLLKNENKVIPYEKLLDLIEAQSQKSLISMIYKIQKKIPIKIIENVKDIGYILKR